MYSWNDCFDAGEQDSATTKMEGENGSWGNGLGLYTVSSRYLLLVSPDPERPQSQRPHLVGLVSERTSWKESDDNQRMCCWPHSSRDSAPPGRSWERSFRCQGADHRCLLAWSTAPISIAVKTQREISKPRNPTIGAAKHVRQLRRDGDGCRWHGFMDRRARTTLTWQRGLGHYGRIEQVWPNVPGEAGVRAVGGQRRGARVLALRVAGVAGTIPLPVPPPPHPISPLLQTPASSAPGTPAPPMLVRPSQLHSENF